MEPCEQFDKDHPIMKEPGWHEYRKKVTTMARRISGPFVVNTSEGPLTCADGWLCMDARGYPYPVAADEFALIYEPATRGAAD